MSNGVYTISELSQFGISRGLVRRHLDYLASHGLARRCDPGRGSSPWLIDKTAISYLRNHKGGRGRPRIPFPLHVRSAALQSWKEHGVVCRVANILGVSARTAKRFLEREGALETEKA